MSNQGLVLSSAPEETWLPGFSGVSWCGGVVLCPVEEEGGSERGGLAERKPCEADERRCGDADFCVAAEFFCDYDHDCPNSFDEQNCSTGDPTFLPPI